MHGADGDVRAHFRALADWLAETPAERVAEKRREADLLFHRVGITFAVYGDEAVAERLIPCDTIPRVIPASEWEELARGLRQRVAALNRFLHDVYHEQDILKAGVIPAEQVLTNDAYQVAMLGLELTHRVYAHIAGIDLIRHDDGKYYVLEDNLRTPSGVSYMLENRRMMMRLFPELFARQPVRPVEHYPALLLETLRAVAAPQVRDPMVVVLTPGQYNSAYFEHAFLAQQMGVELVVKEVQGSGGYGMLVGPAASRAEIDAFRERIRANPANYIAQPTMSLSTCPTFVESGVAPRHVDLRPFVLSGKEIKLIPGGL